MGLHLPKWELPWESECSLPHTLLDFFTFLGVYDVTPRLPLSSHPCDLFALTPGLPLGPHACDLFALTVELPLGPHACNLFALTAELLLGPQPCNPFALVASPKLGLRHLMSVVLCSFLLYEIDVLVKVKLLLSVLVFFPSKTTPL